MENNQNQDQVSVENHTEASKLAEGTFDFSSSKEEGAAAIRNNSEELVVSMVAPMEALLLNPKKVSMETPSGRQKDVLQVELYALSPKGTEGAALLSLQLDTDTLTKLVADAQEKGILPKSEPESKWGRGGKMEQMVEFAKRISK